MPRLLAIWTLAARLKQVDAEEPEERCRQLLALMDEAAVVNPQVGNEYIEATAFYSFLDTLPRPLQEQIWEAMYRESLSRAFHYYTVWQQEDE